MMNSSKTGRILGPFTAFVQGCTAEEKEGRVDVRGSTPNRQLPRPKPDRLGNWKLGVGNLRKDYCSRVPSPVSAAPPRPPRPPPRPAPAGGAPGVQPATGCEPTPAAHSCTPRRFRLMPLARSAAYALSSARSAPSDSEIAVLPGWHSYGSNSPPSSGVSGNETVNARS